MDVLLLSERVSKKTKLTTAFCTERLDEECAALCAKYLSDLQQNPWQESASPFEEESVNRNRPLLVVLFGQCDIDKSVRRIGHPAENVVEFELVVLVGLIAGLVVQVFQQQLFHFGQVDVHVVRNIP